MRGIWWIPALGMVLLVASACSQAKYKEPSDLRKAIEQQLSIGSSKEQVVSFLNFEGIEHSYRKTDANDEQISAIVRDVSGVIITSSLRAIFHFDQSGHLAKYEVDEVLTGP